MNSGCSSENHMKGNQHPTVKRVMESEFQEIFKQDHFTKDNMSITKHGNARFYKYREGRVESFAPTYKIEEKMNKEKKEIQASYK